MQTQPTGSATAAWMPVASWFDVVVMVVVVGSYFGGLPYQV